MGPCGAIAVTSDQLCIGRHDTPGGCFNGNTASGAGLGIYQKAGLTPVGEALIFDARPLVSGESCLMKQVIVVNRSLSLPKGKLAAQVAHAAVGAFIAASAQAQMAWLQAGMPKIVI